MNMGFGPSRLSTTQTTEKIGRLIKDLDTECDDVIHKDMRPEEVVLLIMLHRKHSDKITYNASHVGWTWRTGSLKSEYYERLGKLKEEGKVTTNRSSNNEAYIKKVEKELIDVDSEIFVDDNNDVEHSSSDEESEEKLMRYFNEQNIKLANLNKERVREILDEAQHGNSSDVVGELNIKDNLLKKLEKLNNRYKEDMLTHLKTQSDKMTEILNQYHEDQLQIVKRMDEDRVMENERRTCPSSSELLSKLKTDDDPELDADSRRLIDDMTNNIRKKTIKPEELQKLFKDHRDKEQQLKVSVPLPHRDYVPNGEDDQQYRDVVANHIRDHPDISPHSIINRGNEVQAGFDRWMQGAKTAR